ncbi:MAG: type IV secretory system conjugative DNA transfer family protein [Oscillospiraceae bacterium]|nr:type IV secretory system conjugative DNA transfer family protein [Oscillospiraceae bacterium]
MKNCRILAQDCYMSNDTWVTGLNNNDLIIGPSGAGKTRGYVKPNILQCNESMIIADTKGNLIDEVGPVLRDNGYKVILMDFKDLSRSYGYNPLEYIRYDKRRKKYVEQDIMTIAEALVPVTSQREPFWEVAAKMYLTSLIAYVMECLPKREHTLKYVIDLFGEIHTGNFRKLLGELQAVNPDSFAVQSFKLFEDTGKSEKTEASITGVLGEKLNGLGFDAAVKMYSARKRIHFQDLGREKTAVFLTISDTDRSMDRMVSLFYTQALHTLCDSADLDYPDHRLSVPVRFILDDFATNAVIPNFDNLTSVIRSREIYVSIILQSITQLYAIYGRDKSVTIINNCDNCLYLGGQDITTARFMGEKANKTPFTILNMPLSDAYLFTRGSAPQKVKRFDIRTHPNYKLLPEAAVRTKKNEVVADFRSAVRNMEGGESYGL